MEIRDVDQWATPDEVAEALSSSSGLGRETIKVLNMRKRYGGTQVAIVLMPTTAADGLLTSGRLRVGMVSCRVRMAKNKVRCFRCLTFGHMSKDCEGPDRSQCCRRCGVAGHRAISCSASAQAISDFARMVAETKST